ncbi:MAG TPA: YeeE/YedE family protein, partial [Candidatus Bathyarchaeia archaeon]|nr:YeeE/YedE family protein [Candidatus Bathyarchaeia archaeon]
MEDVPWTLYLSAVGTGLIFGYVAQRGGFCFTRALSAAVLSRDLRLLRAGVLALIVATVGVQLLATLGLVDLPLRPLRWVANIVGGLFFGAGMILGGGDTASTWYRVGEGAIGAWVVLLGFALGATTSGLGILLPLRTLLQRPTITIGDDGVPTLANVFGLSPWIIVAVLAVAGAVWLARGARGAEGDRWSWPVTGVAVGVVIAGAWWTSAIGDRPVGIALAVST